MVLISNDASYCGLAYVMNDPRTFNYPFSVVSPNCLPLTLAHELGHNFGMQHDHDQYTAGGATRQRLPPASTGF
jgi:Metallo-peptidase family M12